jgi:kynurenine formamidase
VTHDVLLRNGVILIEYFSNTAALTAPLTFLCCPPLEISDADRVPARVIALEEI